MTRILSTIGVAILLFGPTVRAGDFLRPVVVEQQGQKTGSWKDRTIPPVANLLTFEDPIIRNEIRPIFIYHRMSDEFFTGGGDAFLTGAQLRFAVTERLQIIITKGGYLWIYPEVGDDAEGFGNLVMGAKYTLIDREEDQFILTPGFTYEIPTGSEDILHGRGDGIFHLFVSAAKGWGNFHLTGQVGWMQAIDTEVNSSLLQYNLQADYWVNRYFIPFVSFSGWTVIDAGENLVLGSEGYDAFNFGATGSEGVTQGTIGLGFRSRVTDQVDLGIAWQKATIQPKGAFDDRITLDFGFRW